MVSPVDWKRPALIAACVAAGFSASTAFAETPSEKRISELEQKLERSLHLIEQLSAKVQELESRSSPKAALPNAEVSESMARHAARIDAVEQQVSQLGSGIGRAAAPETGLPLHGFADVGYAHNSSGNPKGFSVGSVDFYLTPQFSDRVKTLVELIFETDGDNLATDLERAQIGYTFSDQLTLWAGRFHTPYGYWNTGFHHGAQIQTSILRPRFIDFEDAGGILPAHTVGLWGVGSVRLGEGKLNYDAYLGNGPKIIYPSGTRGDGELHPNTGGDNNHSALVGLNVGYQFGEALDGLRLGAHWLRGDVRSEGGVTLANTRLDVSGVYGYFNNDVWEALGEYYHFDDETLQGGSGTHKSWAGFFQLGRNLGTWTPYARVERAALDQQDLYFAEQASGRSYRRQALGLRYDVDPKSALKLEVNHTRIGDGMDLNFTETRLQYSIRF